MARLSSGDLVEVRSKQEILRTLDKQGRLEGMPFMPQMFDYCGKRFKVYKRAHKTCDTIVWNWDSPGRSVDRGIHLNLRCSGDAYGGCQAACLIFWKEQWLKSVDVAEDEAITRASDLGEEKDSVISGEVCTESDVVRGTHAGSGNDQTVYNCQATRLLDFSKPLPWWHVGQYMEDYESGNATLWQIARGFIYMSYYYGTLAKLGGPGGWIYDHFQSLWGGLPFPRRRGKLRSGQSAPLDTLNLQEGELVRVKSYDDILRTIDKSNKNRGMTFDGEMMPFCGKTYRVRNRVERFIDEKTGKMKTLKTPAVILDNVYCQARYSESRMFCPRSIFSWWREVWLERVPAPPQELASSGLAAQHGERPKPNTGL
jgi:hypothetical protein